MRTGHQTTRTGKGQEEVDSVGHTLLRAAVQLGSHNTAAFPRRRRLALFHNLQGLPCTCSRAAPPYWLDLENGGRLIKQDALLPFHPLTLPYTGKFKRYVSAGLSPQKMGMLISQAAWMYAHVLWDPQRPSSLAQYPAPHC